MITGNAKLVVDLGNSETRIAVMFGKKPGKDEPKRRIRTFSNRYYSLSNNKEWQPAKTAKIEDANIFDVEYPVAGRYATGSVLDREFAANCIRPTSLDKKHSAIITFITFNKIFYEAYQALAEITNTDVESLDVTWDIALLLPPAEVALGIGEIGAGIRSIKEINFVRPHLHKEVKVNNIEVYPEGVSAFFNYSISPDWEVMDENDYLNDTRILLVDIGAGTTDISLMDHGEALNEAQDTISTGGNSLNSKVMSLIRKGEGINITPAATQQAIITGKTKDGGKEINIVPYINQANEMVADTINRGIIEYLESNQIAISGIEYLLVFGGGSMKSNADGVVSISEYIINRIKGYAPNIQLLGLPANKEGSVMSPRMMNIYGACAMMYVSSLSEEEDDE